MSVRSNVYRICVCATAVVLLFAAAGLCAEGDDAALVFARKAFNDGFYDLAQERLEAFLKANPADARLPEVRLLLGKTYYFRNAMARALYEFEAVLASPQGAGAHDEALYWTGEIYLKNGDYRKALELDEQVLTVFPGSKFAAHALFSKGWAYYKLGLFREAVACFTDVATGYPYEPIAQEALFKAGECRYLMADYAGAGKALASFVETYPVSARTADAYYMLGESRFYQAQYSDAVAAFERALAIAPKSSWASFALYRMAGCRLALGDFASAAGAYAQCRERGDNQFLVSASMLGLVQVYEKLGKRDDARALADEIIEKYPASDAAGEARYRKVRLLYDAEQYADAEAVCRSVLEVIPAEGADRFRYELGWILVKQGRSDAAIPEFEWIRGRSKDINLIASALCAVGDIYYDRKEYAKAMEYYDTVISKYQDSFWTDYAQYRIGMVFTLSGKDSQAALAFQTVLTNFPNSSWRDRSLFGLGAACYALGDYERAATEFRRLIDETDDAALLRRAKLFLATTLCGMKRYGEALEALSAVDRDGVDLETRMMARYQTGVCYEGMGRSADALALFARFLQDHPGSDVAIDVQFRLAEHYRSRKDTVNALRYYDAIRQKHPQDGIGERAFLESAFALAEAEKQDEAIARFEELVAGYPGTASARTAYRKIALVKKNAGDCAGGIASLQKALSADNDELNAQIQYEIAECYEAKGDLARAVEEYLKVPYLYARGTFWSVRATLKCAQVLERLERIAEARRLYEKLAAMDIEESRFAKQRIEWLKWRGEKGN